ncbi:hypothetical protein [Candidatus Methanoperedens nitratireducens]|nr:hypothetical protein [Candidatus Methanoperedens nitroreducens]
MTEPGLANPITEPLLFWTVILYLAFLFHSWKIKELNDDIKSIEILFLSGALGYVFLKLSDYLTPIIDVHKWLNYLKSLDPFGPSLMFNLYFGIILILIYYLLLALFTFLILSIIQFCVDPNKQILYKYHRFKILRKYKITELLGIGIPLILLSFGGIFFAIGGIMVFSKSMKFSSLDFWSIIYLLSPIFGIIFLLLVLIGLGRILYLTFKKYSQPFIHIILDKVKKFQFTINSQLNVPYLFSWDKIPGSDNERLLDFLKKNYGVDWIKRAQIKKIDPNTIFANTAYTKNYILLILNNKKTKVNLEIGNGRTDEFIVEIKNNKLNIYNFLNFNKKQKLLLIYIWIYLAIITLIEFKGEYLFRVIIDCILLLLLFIILIFYKKIYTLWQELK